MKKILLSVFAIAAMASCMQDEVISQDQQAIDFGTPFVDKATKAEDLTYNATNLKEFLVYGTVQGAGTGVVNIFDGDLVEGAVGANVWSCGVNQYWIEGAKYNFAAVVDATVTTGEFDMPSSLTPVPAAHGNLCDMLYDTATATGQARGYNDKVNFEFKHLLAKAYFTVSSNTQDGYYYNVKNITVQNISTGASYVISKDQEGNDTSAWGGTTTLDTDAANWISFGDILAVTSADNNKTNTYQTLLIPTAESFKVSFTVELCHPDANGNEVVLNTTTYAGETAKEVDTDLVKGHAYNFKLNLTVGELIQFTVTQAPSWVEPTDQNGGNITL